MSVNLKKIIQYITSPEYQYPLNQEFIEILHNEQLKIEYAEKNDLLISNEMPSKSIVLLLDGYCCAEKYSPSGKLLKSIAAGPIQMYGLFEAVHPTLTKYTSTIRCITPCAYIRIANKRYIDTLLTDPIFGWINIQYLSSFINRVLTENDDLLLHSTQDKLLLYLYQHCVETHFPAIVRVKKEELAQILNISLRTLYRQLDILYAEGLISSNRGKILITEEQYREIGEILDSLL